MIHSQRTVNKANKSVMLDIYRAQLSIVIQTERELVSMGLLKPEERRVFSREERRQLTQKTE